MRKASSGRSTASDQTSGELQQIAGDERRRPVRGHRRFAGHTPCRGIGIIGNHNSYHLGEFASLRQVMGSWGPGHS